MSETTPRTAPASASVPTYGAFWKEAASWWDKMERNKLSMAKSAAKKILLAKAKYQTVESKTGVPWFWIGPTHFRESDCDFSTQLAQGDPLNRVSTHVPRGQGPYFGPDAWERAALIALETDGLNKVQDWRLEKMLFWWESYNGWGYRRHKVPSAYVWAGTSIYVSGFYVADGQWSATGRDSRIGCAPVLKCLMDLDNSIKIQREAEDDTAPPVFIGGPPELPEDLPPITSPIEPPPEVVSKPKTEIKIEIEDGRVTVWVNGVEMTHET